MKRSVLKSLSVIVIVLIMMFSVTSTAFAETIQDRLENYLNGAVEEYETAVTPEDQESVQDQVDSWLSDNGFGSIDLGAITDTDIGSVVSGLLGDSGGGSILDSLSGIGGMITDAFNSGLGMITDAIGGGFGTSDGSNTATTEPATSPNVIIADDTTKKENATQAVGVPNVQAPATQVAPNKEPSTSEVTTYNVGSSVQGNLVGSGVTTTNVADTNSVVEDDGASAITVLVILSVATLVIIVTMVVFFLMKRKY